MAVKSLEMRRPPLGRLTIRTALSLGFGLTLGLWLIIGYQFAQGIAEVERQAGGIAGRYVQAQELLSALRADVLACSGIVRDALLDGPTGPRRNYSQDLRARLGRTDTLLDRYAPVLSSPAEHDRLTRVRAEARAFGSGMQEVVARARVESADARQVLDSEVLPRRASLLRVIEDLQALNRAAFIQYQADLAGIHGAAERQTWQRLGLALAISLGIAVFATLYAGQLEKRLVSQLDKDARNTRALQDLSTRLLTAQEEERRRIARELHDEVGQALTAVKVELTLAERAAQASGAPAGLLDAAQSMADGALHTVRDLSHLLHPAVLDDLGLPDAVEGYLREFSTRFRVKAELRQEGMNGRLTPAVEVAAYRMIQEALTNVVKHAEATRCQVTLCRRADRLDIGITDDGVGFLVAELDGASGRKGLGLIGIRERTLQLGGRVQVESAPRAGTSLRIELPIPPRQPVSEPAIPPEAGTLRFERL